MDKAWLRLDEIHYRAEQNWFYDCDIDHTNDKKELMKLSSKINCANDQVCR